MKMDSNGNMLWNVLHQYNGARSSSSSSVQCFDGSYIVGGYAYTHDNYNMWLFKTDENRNTRSNSVNKR